MNKIKNVIVTFSLSLIFIIGLAVWIISTGAIVDKTFDGVIGKYFVTAKLRSEDNPEKVLADMIYNCMAEGNESEVGKLSDLYKFKYYVQWNNATKLKNAELSDIKEGGAKKIVIGYDKSETENCVVYILLEDVKESFAGKIFVKTIEYLGEKLAISYILAGISLLITVTGAYALIVNSSMIYKIFYAVAIVTVVEALLISHFSHGFSALNVKILIGEKTILLAVAYFYYYNFTKLQKKAVCISGLQEDENKLIKKQIYPYSMKMFAKELDRAEEKINAAVEDKIKSERLKTELISNVSHDIKTPLTSIISFSDLIANEETENDKITEYATRLHDQSNKMKTLLETLIELSKVSAGAVEINIEPCNVQTLLEQCVVEYEEKFEQNNIIPEVIPVEDMIYISADVKALNRILDNIMNNICKYALSGNKAYIEASANENEVTISFRNMAKNPIRANESELTERFVRGDASRHSEGHGLGLAIVKSLMELMGGRLEIDTNTLMFETKLVFERAAQPKE